MREPVSDGLVEDVSGETVLRGMRLCLEFDGSNFEGWQRQPSGRTVQGEVESALAKILGSPHSVLGCGRTDSGTHARGMIASVRTTHAIAAAELGNALDAVLPPDVALRTIDEVDPSFHPLRDAQWKWYRYRILVSPRRHPLLEAGSWRRTRIPNLATLNEAASALVGRHDFASFANAGSPVRDTVRTLHALRWIQRPLDRGDGVPLPESEGFFLCLDAIGDGFLYKMVRTLVGTMISISEISISELSEPAQAGAKSSVAEAARRVLDARDRTVAGPAVPARGLTLMAVALDGQPPPVLPQGLAVVAGSAESSASDRTETSISRTSASISRTGEALSGTSSSISRTGSGGSTDSLTPRPIEGSTS